METPVARSGQIAHEPGLPHPWVRYPSPRGVFLTFSNAPDGPWHFCECAESAIAEVPDWQLALINADPTGPRLHAACHRCNLLTPSLRWHDQGSQFAQFHGWYIEQARFRAGFSLKDSVFFAQMDDAAGHSESAAPELVELRMRAHPRLYLPEDQWFIELRQMIARHTGTWSGHRDVTSMTWAIWHGVLNPKQKLRQKDLEAISEDDWHVVADWKRQLTPDPSASRKWRRLFEDEARAEFGYRKIGDGFVAETQLAALVAEIVGPDVIVERHHRPDWLDRLELDIWIPDLRVGIEYQGQQHYKPVEAWGGETALARQQKRDTRKRQLCAVNGVTLIEVSYTEPLTRTHIETRLGLGTSRLAEAA